ncbi:hypothetical protein QTI33_08695 [Variovorax sp. J22P271]|uniref:hypothetical protein n=1 Tax=Variovorax davisae TaxID=3053515 RepID=UPI0025768EBC|nr:hypothetical protein [Variovorax sp. J22P271]MDM0032210.1 hypothetical protein [Variovorax sp. J22P271]
MAIDLLREIASSPLPKSFRSLDEIDQVRLLRAAGLVIAFVPARAGPESLAGPEHIAQVLAVTDKGRQELEPSRYPDEELVSSQSNGNLAQRLRWAAARVRQALH